MERANASQLAARNIRQAKSRRRTPVQSDGPVQQSMSFQGGAAGQGLFGGSIQAPSTFNFAPSGGPTFPPTAAFNPFANGSASDASDNEDPRADTTGEEAKRRNRPFQRDPDSTLQQSNPFNQQNTFGQSQQKPASSPFSSLSTTTPGIFGQTPVQDKPTANIFSYNTTQPTQSAPSGNFNNAAPLDKSTSNIFGGPTQQPVQPATAPMFGFLSQDKPANSLFSFGSATTAQVTNNTSSLAATNPASNLFGNLQPPTTQSTIPAINFSSAPAVDRPISNLFGASQASAQLTPPGISFPPASKVDEPVSTLFGVSQALPGSSSNIFAPSGQSAPGSNIFGNSSLTAPSTSTMFGSQTQNSNPSSNPFGKQTQQPPGTSLFSGLGQTPTKPVLETQSSTAPPSGSIFGVGGVNKLTETSSIFSTLGQQTQPSSNNIFGGLERKNPPQSELFGSLNRATDQPGAQSTATNGTLTNGDSATTSTANGSTAGSLSRQPSSNIFGTPKPLFPLSNAQAVTTERADKPLFSRESVAAPPQLNGNTSFFPMKPTDMPPSATQPPANGMLPSISQSPSKSTEISRTTTFSGSTPIASSSSSTNGLTNGIIVQKQANGYADIAAAAAITDDSLRSKVPSTFNGRQRDEFNTAYRLRSLNKALSDFLVTIPPTGDVGGAITFYFERRADVLQRVSIDGPERQTLNEEDQKNENPNPNPFASLPRPEIPQASKSSEKDIVQPGHSQTLMNSSTAPEAPMFPAPHSLQSSASLGSPSAMGKRKAEIEFTKDHYEKSERQSKRLNINGLSNGSNTSNIFKSIVDPPSPEKKIRPLPEASKDETPRVNPFANLPMTSSPATTSTLSALSASSAPNNTFAPKPTAATVNPFSKSATTETQAATSLPKSAIKAPNFGSSIGGAVNFYAQFNQQASKNEAELMQKAKDEDYDSDDDEAEWEANWKAKRAAEKKAIEEAAKSKRASFVPGQGFSFGSIEKPSIQNSTISASGMNNNLFGSNAAPKAEKLKPDVSDTGATIGSLTGSKPELAKPSNSNSTGSSMFSFLNVKPSEPTKAMSDGGGSNSIFSSLNPSRSSTPAMFDKSTNNIFGHLISDNEASVEEDETDSETGEADVDSENKDPSYRPHSANGNSSPGTPAEETGPGIASVKKTPFGPHNGGLFAAPSGTGLFSLSKTTTPTASGAATPAAGRSLFDRITKDINGKPQRQLDGSSDDYEKENTQPSTTNKVFNDAINPFASSFSNTSEAPADQTWKKDSPIRFGSATPNADSSKPVVSVTAATPTKSFSNLFGNSNSSTPKPVFPSASAGVGFSFGGSNASSLFPSTAVSTSTSRATSPGGTTDGESAAEGDPDAEKHEQINLTAGGPGEEDEDVLYECRTKALMWSKSTSGWDTKGLGPLRVLKHKETDAVRILLRADPSGAIILNKSLLPTPYEANAKTVKLTTSGEEGKLETWLLQVKSVDLAKDLAKVLETNKPAS